MAEVDVSGFVRVCSELSRLSGKDFPEILLPQVAAVLSACIRRTPVRTIGQIAKRMSKNGGYIEFADGTIISTFKKADHAEMFFDDSGYDPSKWPKGTPVPYVKGGKSWHAMDDPKRHWSNHRWARFQTFKSLLALRLKERQADRMDRYKATLAARGLAKKTWLQIADELGLDVQAAGYVRNANYRGRDFQEGFARKIVEQGAFVIELTNTNPLVCGKLDGYGIIAGALRDREKAFDIDLEKGVFDDLKRRAQRYPGIFVAE